MLAILIGFFSGIISGMGVGGGMILIPALTMLLGVNQHTAQTINLVYFVPTAVVALIVHIKNKNVKFSALPMIITGIPCSLLGAYIAVRLSSSVLSKCFAVFIFICGVRELMQLKKQKAVE